MAIDEFGDPAELVNQDVSLSQEQEQGLEPKLETQEQTATLSQREIFGLLKDIIDKVEIEESSHRSVHLQLLKKLDNFWHGIQRIFWSATSKDWVNVDGLLYTDPELYEEFGGTQPVINVYKAHGESVIAALSQSIPSVKFFPADADQPGDIIAARGYSRISELVQKHNKAQILYTQALFTLWNQSFVAAYHYPVEDEKFGIFEKKSVKQVPVKTQIPTCPTCGQDLPPETGFCDTCGVEVTEPVIDEREEIIEEPVVERIPKSRQVIDVYGPLNVLIQHNVRDVKDTGVLILYTEQDIAKVRSQYMEVADKIREESTDDSWYRELAGSIATGGSGEVTLKQCWIRPWMFWRLGDQKRDEIQELTRLYPEGCYIVVINDEVFEVHNELLDNRWTFSKSPLSRNVHADPIGETLVSIQETRNDLYALGIETVKHGIPETFVDTKLLAGMKYNEVSAKPGMVIPVHKQMGQSIADSFHQLKTATLSKELDTFTQRLDGDGQFLTGASPTIYGGDVGGSQTAKEYETRRAQALQRLQIHWKTLTIWWAELMSKVVVEFAKSMKEDEKFVVSKGNSFMNVWIRKEEIEAGEIGQIEPDVSDQFPISTAQKKDLLVQVLQLNNEYLNSVIYHPENATLVANILGFPEIYIPGDEDRSKQLNEINSLLNGLPAEVEPLVDNSLVHIEICKAWLNSDAGQDAKVNNPQGYMMIVQHLQMHLRSMPVPSNDQGESDLGQDNSEKEQDNDNIDSGSSGNVN
jgi:hypothetical protein